MKVFTNMDGKAPLDGSVTNTKLAGMATKTYKGRTSAGTGVPEDVTVATLKADLLLVKADVGLGSVDNTADTAKPVSTAQQTALDFKAPLASPTFTADAKTTPVDADSVMLMDSAAANILKKLTWANLKVAFLATLNTWTKTQSGTVTALTSTTNSIAVNMALTNNFSHTMTENTTLAAPSNAVAGTTGCIIFTQDAGTARTLAFNTAWKPASGTTAIISTTLGSTNVMTYVVESSGVITYGWANKGIA
jgi:hypothetical protein